MAGTQRDDSSRAKELVESLKSKEHQGFDVAWIARGGTIKYAVSPWTRHDPVRIAHSGIASSVVKLIEGVYASEPQWGLAWIRNRIWTTESWGVASSATVQVAARRVGWEASWQDFYAQIQALGADRTGGFQVQELPGVELAPEPDPGEVLKSVWAELAGLKRCNRAKVIRTRHAEVELIRAFYGALSEGQSPLEGLTGLEIRVSLKCCKMCAAWIFEAFAGKIPFKVLYQEYDPGRLAQFTALEVATPQRRQAVQKLGLEPSWTHRELESFWVGPGDISR